MAFTGSATVQQITDRKVHIGGTLSLAGDATGTIGLFGDSGAGVQLPKEFTNYAEATKYDGVAVGLPVSINVLLNITTDVTAAVPISITKGGTPFRISLHNDSAATASANFEIIIDYL